MFLTDIDMEITVRIEDESGLQYKFLKHTRQGNQKSRKEL